MRRSDAAALDATDPLAGWRERFVAAGDGGAIDRPLYADGNSLGPPMAASRDAIDGVIGEWATRLVEAWETWIDLPGQVGDRLASRLLGARPGEVIATDNTTVNLYKLACAAVDDRPGRHVIITDADNFPTDRYVLQGIAAARGLELRTFPADPIGGPDADSLGAALGDDVALVCLSHVAYRSGALADMAELTAVAHDAGAHLIWDVSHSVGVVPVQLAHDGVTLAVGCTYKYLNAGPGAPAFLYVAEPLQERFRSPIWGWFGQADQFAMAHRYEPAPGMARFMSGTPDIIGLASLGAAVDALPDVEALRAKSESLTAAAVALIDEWVVPLGGSLATPRDPARRGGHVSLAHPQGWALCRALIEVMGVLPDFREPDVVRFGLAPLSTSHVDVWDLIDRTRQVLERGTHHTVDASPRRVT